MKRNLVAPLLLVPALLAMESREDGPAFAPKEGTVLTKRFTSQIETSLDEMEAIMNGQDMGEMLGDMDISSNTTIVTEVTDTYGSVSGGRPAKLSRSFDEVSSEMTTAMSGGMGMGSDEPLEMTASSDLEGTTVHFKWDADAEDYDVEFDEESDAEEELLEGLVEDMDLREFLPDGEVAVGDAWDVDPSALRSLLSPGGDLKLSGEDAGGMGMMGGGSAPPNVASFLEDFDGEITAKFASVEEGLAIIELSIDVASSSDMTEWYQEMMEEQDFQGMEIEFNVDAFDMEYTFEGDGELRWDMASGHFESLSIEGEIEQITDNAVVVNAQGQEMSMEQSMSFSGTQTIEYTTGG